MTAEVNIDRAVEEAMVMFDEEAMGAPMMEKVLALVTVTAEVDDRV